MPDAEHVLLTRHGCVDVDFHVGLLHAEDEVVVVDEGSNLAGNLVVSRANRRPLSLAFLAKGAKIDGVDVNKPLVVDGQLEVVRHELASLARSGAGYDHRLGWEATAATTVSALATSSTVATAALLVVMGTA